MALDMTPEQKTVGRENFQRAVGKLGVSRRGFMHGLLAAGAAGPITAAAYYGYNLSDFSNRPVKAAIIGTGDEGGVLVGEHNPAAVQFIAYSDIRPSNQLRIFQDERATNANSPRRGFKYHYGTNAHKHIRLYSDYRELLRNPEIEMVVIAVPLNIHAQVSIDALNAGKHVLCEKLMAWNIAQCKEMIRVAQQNDRLLSIGHQRHYSMLYAHAQEIIESDVLGEIRHIRALWHRNNAVELPGSTPGDRRYRDSWNPEIKREDRAALENIPPDEFMRRFGFQSLRELVRWRLYNRTGGGLMAELGSHQLDACSIFLGKKKPLAVTAVGGKHFYRDDREVDDHVYCTYEFPGKNFREGVDPRDNETVVVTYSSINTNNFEPYGECVMGSRGTLVVSEEKDAMLWGGNQRLTEVTVTTPAGGRPALDTAASTAPAERVAQSTGAASLGLGVPSRGYREEMEHLAFCIRMRDQASAEDRERKLIPRCHGTAAMADAIVALTANRAMRERRRIEFDRDWFDPQSPKTPDVG